MSFEIEVLYCQELPQDIIDNYFDGEIDRDEFFSVLVMRQDGEILLVENDMMEPEDASFGRSLGWIPGALKKAYEVGRAEGQIQGHDEGYEDGYADGLESGEENV